MRALKSIAADVDRGLAIVALQKQLEDELDGIEERLIADALARPDEHQPLADADREGRQFLAHGTDLMLPIVFTADKLVASFAEGSVVGQRIMAAVPYLKFDLFYKKVIGYAMVPKDGKKFRALAAEQFAASAPDFIALCRSVDKHGIPKSDEKIEWQAAAARKGMEVGA